MKKTITNISHPRDHHWVGDGFYVSSYIPGYDTPMSPETSPFLLLDYMSPYQMKPRSDGHRPGVGYHPHRGFETVTIVYAGEVEHSDTRGNGGIIGPGEVQWMTAGSGLLHSEFFTSEFSRMGGAAEFVQLWVNLPSKYKLTEPRYQALTPENIPEVIFEGGKVRVIAGELQMKTFSARHFEQSEESMPKNLDPSQAQDDGCTTQRGIAKTFSPVELYDVRFDAWGRLELTFPDGYTAMILVLDGEIKIDDKNISTGDMVTFSVSGGDITFNGDKNTKLLVMAGEPIEETVVNYGPFVMNTHEEIMQAFADLRAGRMGKVEEQG